MSGYRGTAMSAAFETHELVVRYRTADGDLTAVDGISLRAEPGSITTLLGPNGAGKTSTVETLEGYRKPSSGSVRVLGLDPIADARILAPRIGVMLQRNGIYVTMHPHDAIHLFASYYPGRALNPSDMLERVGLTHVAKTPWRRLSGGEQQRLSLALALIGRPEVAFLDEPTAGVDPSARLVVRQIISDLRTDGVAVLLTTHDLEEAEKLSDRLVIIDHGRVQAEGSPRELMASASDDGIRFSSSASPDLAGLSAALGAAVREERPGEFLALCPPTPVNVAALTQWFSEQNLVLDGLRAGRHRLEDVFLRLTSDASKAADRPTAARRRSRRGRAS